MTKQNSLQTTLIHAPRQAPQYIETIQPPYFVHQRLFLKQQRTFLIAIGLTLMIIVMAHTVHRRRLH
jgi:hypothetical protein